jgi:hypothetical protein
VQLHRFVGHPALRPSEQKTFAASELTASASSCSLRAVACTSASIAK